MRVRLYRRRSPRSWAQRGLFSAKLSSHPTPANRIPGNGILRPETLVKTAGSLSQETVQSSRDWTSLRQAAEPSGFFNAAVVMPVRGDWLVVLTVPPNGSPQPIFPANREKNRDLFEFLAERLISAAKTADITKLYEKIPCRSEQGNNSAKQGRLFHIARLAGKKRESSIRL